jgi:hypothetical protein
MPHQQFIETLQRLPQTMKQCLDASSETLQILPQTMFRCLISNSLKHYKDDLKQCLEGQKQY